MPERYVWAMGGCSFHFFSLSKPIDIIHRNTQTVGITSLGLEHTSLLGSTYKDIAWQKCGIMKPNCSVYTAVQHEECVRVINERAAEKHVRKTSNRSLLLIDFYY